jgi:hypothetical protein
MTPSQWDALHDVFRGAPQNLTGQRFSAQVQLAARTAPAIHVAPPLLAALPE